MLAVISCVQLCPGFARPGAAQISLWDQIQGPSYNSNDTAPEKPQPEVLNDLRPDATPWRSDAMLNAVAAAMERYQQIVDSGGCPSSRKVA